MGGQHCGKTELIPGWPGEPMYPLPNTDIHYINVHFKVSFENKKESNKKTL